MTVAQDGGKVVSLTHRPLLPPGNAPGTHFCWRLSRPQGNSAIGRILCQWKIPMTPAGIEPATLGFVAQHLNHCTTAVPQCLYIYGITIFPEKSPISTTGCAKRFPLHMFVWSCRWYCLRLTDKGHQNGQLSSGLAIVSILRRWINYAI